MNQYNSDINSIFLEELRRVSRYELIRYPKVYKLTFKQKVKNIGKKILKINTKADKFFWPNGLMAIGLEQAYKEKNNIEDFNCLIQYHDNWIKKGLKINKLDNVINGYSMVFVYEKTKDEKYKRALDSMVEYLLKYPKDKYNNLPYRVNSIQTQATGDILSDSLGMICPFLCRYGQLINNTELQELGIDQLTNFIKFGFDDTKNLPYHAYNAKNQTKLGIIGWGRAVGWLLIGIIDSLEYIDSDHKKYDQLVISFKNIVNTVIKYQNSNGHFSWQLEALEGPIDTSSTAMIAYAIGKGIKIDILEKEYTEYVEKSISALYKCSNNGYIENCSAECRGLSMYPQKYGWYPWSQGPATALVSMFI